MPVTFDVARVENLLAPILNHPVYPGAANLTRVFRGTRDVSRHKYQQRFLRGTAVDSVISHDP